MAATIGKTRCGPCGKDKIAYRCEGCSQTFCVNHLADHHRELTSQLDDIEHQRNLFRQKITEQILDPQQQVLVQEINQWEIDSINLIRQIAEEARQVLDKYATENLKKIEDNLVRLTEELKITREENDFNELHIDQFKEKFKQLEEQVNKPSNISIRHDSSPFIDRIFVAIPSAIEDQREKATQNTSSTTTTTNRRPSPIDYDRDRSNDRSQEWNIRVNEDSEPSRVDCKGSWRDQRQIGDDRRLDERSNHDKRRTVTSSPSSERRPENNADKVDSWRTVERQRPNLSRKKNNRSSEQQQQRSDEPSSSVTAWQPRLRMPEETRDSIRSASNSHSTRTWGLTDKPIPWRTPGEKHLESWDANYSDDEN